MSKKTLIIICTGIVLILAIAIACYFLFFNKTVSDSPSDTYLPFGQTTSQSVQSQNIPNTTAPEASKIPVSALMKISSEPTAGGIAVQTATSSLVHYNLRSTGHVYEMNLLTGTTSKLANTTIPKLYESVWFADGKRMVLRYLDASYQHITTYNAALTSSLSASSSSLFQMQGTFLPSDITSLVLSPNATKIFFIQATNEGSVGVVTDTTGTTRSQIFTSALSEWTAQWPTASTLILTTKPSYAAVGGVFSVNAQSGSFKKLFGGIAGLITLTNTTGDRIAFSDNTLNLKIYDTTTGTAVPTGIKTLAEKCVWSSTEKYTLYCAVPFTISGANFPDVWYQGQTSFTDNLYKINTLTQEYNLIADLKNNFGISLDATNLSISTKSDYILFTNKQDGSLWSFHLTP